MAGKSPTLIGKAFRITTIAYVLSLPVFLLLTKWIGERNSLLSLALFFPPQCWIISLLVLAPFSWHFARAARRAGKSGGASRTLSPTHHLFRLNMAALLVLCFLYMDFHWSWPREPKGKALTLATNNVGQRKTRALWPFLKERKPDVIALQDAWNQGRALSRENPDYYVKAQGQFVLASRYEILNSGIVYAITSSTGPVAAWYELNFHGKTIVIYNVHMPTPRNDFGNLRGKGFLIEAIRGQGPLFSSEVRERYRKALAERRRLAADLVALLEKEKRPFLVAGDFNMPSPGYLRRLFADKFTDVFAQGGRGYGFTFPGDTRNPLVLFQPWLRLDYVFSGKEWRVLSSEVEPRQWAQHLAVIARVELE